MRFFPRGRVPRSWPIYRPQRLGLLVTTALLALMLAAALTPLAGSRQAGATTCPPGYVPGPDTEVVNSDGSVTRTPGPCIPAPPPDIPIIPGGFIDRTQTEAEDDPVIDLADVPILVDPSATETPPVDAGDQPPDQEQPDQPDDGGTIDVSDVPILVDIDATPTADEDAETAEVQISKTECPLGYDAYHATIYDLALNCSTPMADVGFFVKAGDQLVAQGTTDAYGSVAFPGLPSTSLHVFEGLPAKYGQPVMFCTSYTIVDNQPVEDGPHKMTRAFGPVISYDLKAGETLSCNWFNVPIVERGSITIAKYTCPAGYDDLAYGADPATDCPTATDGVTFALKSATDANDQARQSDTGDSTPGAVYFGGLRPDTYTVTEAVPAGTEAVFILDCAGSSLPLIQSVPLSYGPSLTIELAEGDDVVCRWYNVPKQEERGDIEVTKYVCGTQSFVSADYCQRYEGVQSFTLTGVTGPGAGGAITGTTDAYGRLVFQGLLPGTYELDEVNATWCAAVADYTDAAGYLVVDYGTTTHVDVFNCGVKEQPTTPIKYPNTGAGPNAAAPADAELTAE